MAASLLMKRRPQKLWPELRFGLSLSARLAELFMEMRSEKIWSKKAKNKGRKNKISPAVSSGKICAVMCIYNFLFVCEFPHTFHRKFSFWLPFWLGPELLMLQ